MSLLGLFVLAAAFAVFPGAGAGATGQAVADSAEPFCYSHVVCPDTRTHRTYEGSYIGHDEPSVLFYSTQPGSGNSNTRTRTSRTAPTRTPPTGSATTSAPASSSSSSTRRATSSR